METKFQTSFIPKKPLVTEQRIHIGGGTSIFMFIAMLLFVVSLGAAGLTFVGKSLLLSKQTQSQADLKDKQKHFDLTTIENLKKADAKITLATGLLNNHIAVSEVFDIVSKLTIEGVRFKTLEYTAPDPKNKDGAVAKISMKGLANSFSSIAFQSDVFGKSEKYGTNKVLKNPILSDLAVDENGGVGFSFSADIAPADLSYEKVLTQSLQDEGILPENNPQ